jgi:Tfp pilus assembly protein PilF
MAGAQEQYDDAMFAFSQGEYETAITQLKQVLEGDPNHFDAQLALGMAYYRMGDYQNGHPGRVEGSETSAR